MTDLLTITDDCRIPMDELVFSYSRSGGPGGQNVNKRSTKVTVQLDVASSPSLSDDQRARILDKLSSRLTTDGVLVLHSQTQRTQEANRAAAVARLTKLLGKALKRPRARKPTKVPRAVIQRRLDKKRHRGATKKLRKPPRGE